MRKHAAADGQIGYADLTVGLGPALVAARHAHVVVETSWDGLATVITEGASLPLAREPREIAENARDRYVYATVDGVFRTKARIGDSVRQDHGVAEVGAVVLTALLDRVLRGLIHDDVPVTVGTKVIEVDPRGSEAEVRGLGERARRVAEAVLQAVSGWAPQLSSWVRALHLILRGEQEPQMRLAPVWRPSLRGLGAARSNSLTKNAVPAPHSPLRINAPAMIFT